MIPLDRPGRGRGYKRVNRAWFKLVTSHKPTVVTHFRTQAALYAEHRPDYPAELFEFVAANAPARKLAWDCATGNGQAAVGLAEHFERVIATDASPEQIAHARPHKRIEYRVAAAEASGLPSASVDAITVTQALHWLDLEKFYAEVRRVLVPNGTLTVTVYSDPVMDDAKLSAILQHYNKQVVGPHWPPERKLVDEQYCSLPFPFDEIPAPELTLERQWSLAELAGYLRSWSATVRYIKANGSDPVVQFEREMARLWNGGNPEAPKMLRWPFTIRSGRVRASR